ncbi:unnamed protein product [Mytilus edulis]|uniref:Uncharacterized protein n=1 Tax=Mytilus edulis TaxID=6550 RepID=A0A8S3U7L3_MYTED|nr:unnamed protein product [Mytilus edulis]
MVWSTISYGAAVWGDKSFSCINAVQNKAIRFFMGVGRYTPNVAVNGDSGWTPPFVKQWRVIINYWNRLRYMDENRINKKIDNWAEQNFRRHRVCKNSNFRIYSLFESCGIANLFNDTDIDKQQVNNAIHVKLMSDFKQKWNEDLHKDTTRRNGPGGNKLRT